MRRATIRPRPRDLGLGLCSLVVAVGAYAAGCIPVEEEATVVRGVSVVDVGAGTADGPVDLLVVGNRIASIGPPGELEAPANATEVDASGRFAIPGLWDMHVHALQDGVHERMFPMFIANGVTGVRDMNGPMALDSIRALRERVLAGEVPGPRFVAPGPLLDGPGRGPDALGPMVRWVDTPEKARDSVRALAARGADFIKTYNRITPGLYEAILDEARSLGVPVMGHVPMAVDPLVASAAGQASMEHTQGVFEGTSSEGPGLFAVMERLMEQAASGGSPTLADAAELFAARRAIVGTYDPARASALFSSLVRHGNWQCVTLVSNRVLNLVDAEREAYQADPRLRYIPPSTQAEMAEVSFLRGFGNPDESLMRQRWQQLLDVVGAMDAAGVPILAGTDAGAAYTYAGFSLHDELELLVEAGLTPRAALHAATLGPAELLGATDSLGVVAPGMIADLVLLEANPLEDIAAVRRVSGVVANGRWHDRAALDAMLEEAAAFAASDRATGGAVR